MEKQRCLTNLWFVVKEEETLRREQLCGKQIVDDQEKNLWCKQGIPDQQYSHGASKEHLTNSTAVVQAGDT